MELLYNEKDYFSRQLLYRHCYMLEVGNIYLDRAVKTPTSKYSDVKISVTEAEEAVLKNHDLAIDKNELAAVVANLCLQKYLTMDSEDGKMTMYHTITEPGSNRIWVTKSYRRFRGVAKDS